MSCPNTQRIPAGPPPATLSGPSLIPHTHLKSHSETCRLQLLPVCLLGVPTVAHLRLVLALALGRPPVVFKRQHSLTMRSGRRNQPPNPSQGVDIPAVSETVMTSTALHGKRSKGEAETSPGMNFRHLLAVKECMEVKCLEALLL